MLNSKSQLAIVLSKLNAFQSPKIMLEQYTTDSEIAAEVIWSASMAGDIKGKTVADLGCGTGILGIGAILTGAKKTYFVDTDTSALELLENNLKQSGIKNGYEILNKDISEFNETVDTVIQNPPFGTKEKHIDVLFLDKAMQTAKVIYSLHKTATSEFIIKHARGNGFAATQRYDFEFPLKQTMKHHMKRIQRVQVTAFRFEKKE